MYRAPTMLHVAAQGWLMPAGLCMSAQVTNMNKEGQLVDVNYSRLALCDATAKVMAAGFNILGLRYVPRM